jgi:DHA1 family multidrug resistance protein-like MFS transporter
MKKLDKKIFSVLFFSIFATVTGVGIVVPLLPVYAHDLGASGLYIGLIFGSFSLSRTFLLPYFGRYSDKKGRKPFIVTGLCAYTLISLAFILATNVESLIGIRFVQGITSAMIMPAVQAYVGDITPPGRLSIGPLIGGEIRDRFSLDTSFACMGGLAFVGFLLSLFLLPHTRSESVVSRETTPIEWKRLVYDGDMAGLFLFRLAYAACIGVIWSFLPVLGDTEFSLSSASIGILVTLGIFSSGLLHVPMGFLSDRINRKIMVVTGGIIISYAIFSFQWANSFKDLVAASILFGIGGGISMPALMALSVLKGNSTRAMGSVMGLLAMAHSLGMLTGSLLAGVMMDLFHLRRAFPAGGAIMIICVGLFIVLTYHKKAVPVRTDSRTGPLDLGG